MLRRIDRKMKSGESVAVAMQALTAEPTLQDFVDLAAAANHADDPVALTRQAEETGDWRPEAVLYGGPDLRLIASRAAFYAASVEDKASALLIAQYCLGESEASENSVEETAGFIEAALGWIAVSNECGYLSRRNSRGQRARGSAERYGERYIKDILKAHLPQPPATKASRDVRPLDCDLDIVELREMGAKLKEGLVVIKSIENATTHEGKKILEAYKAVVGVRLPLPAVPDLFALRRRMLAELPHAALVLDAILRDLTGRNHVRLRPTILVGLPGSGKTTFAIRLLTALGVAHQLVPCGGVADAALAGCARQWSTGSPSTPVSLIARYRTAAPGVILDEVEKVSSSKHNGNLLDALLAMLEPVSAVRWLDPYLQSEVDLSAMITICTANSLDGIPPPLRDRCRVLRFPSPTVEHLPVLAGNLLRAAYNELGLSAVWAQPLDGTELQALAECWRGGSVRALRRLVDGVVAARDVSMATA